MPSDFNYLSSCSEDENGNLILDIPEEILEAMGWREGTLLDISVDAGALRMREVTEQAPEQTGVLS